METRCTWPSPTKRDRSHKGSGAVFRLANPIEEGIDMRSSVAFAGAALVMGLAGCSSSSNAGPDLGAFEGTWTPTAVTEIVTCNGQNTTETITDTLTWAQSASNSSEIVSTSSGGSCTFT